MAFTIGTDLNTLQQQLQHTQDEIKSRKKRGESSTNLEARLQQIQQAMTTLQQPAPTPQPAPAPQPAPQPTPQPVATHPAYPSYPSGPFTPPAGNPLAPVSPPPITTQPQPPSNPNIPTTPTTPPPNTQQPVSPGPPPVLPPTANPQLPTPNGPELPPGVSIVPDPVFSGTINPNVPGLSPEDTAAMERVKAMLGIGEAFGRKVANEFYATGSLGRQAEDITDAEKAALARAREFASVAGTQSQDMRSLLGQQQSILSDARNLSPIELEALGIARNALPGLDAAENNALRSAARENINREVSAQARDLAKVQARSGTFGAAAGAQNRLLGQDRVRQTRNLERDLLVQNIGIKEAARNAFTNLVTNTEGNRAGRTNAASSTLANTLTTDEANRKTAQNAANVSEAGLAQSSGDRLRQLREFNLSQLAAEKAGQIGSIFGGIGTVTGQRGLLAGEEYADKELQAAIDAQNKIIELMNKSLKEQKSVL